LHNGLNVALFLDSDVDVDVDGVVDGAFVGVDGCCLSFYLSFYQCKCECNRECHMTHKAIVAVESAADCDSDSGSAIATVTAPKDCLPFYLI